MKTPSEISPYSLIQEHLRKEPWKLLVAVILLNQTSARAAKPVWEEFFRRFPTPESLWQFFTNNADARQDLIALFRPLGFQNRRADRIWRMTSDYICLQGDIDDPTELYGIGKYGADSYNMFVKGELVEDVEDKELRNYVEWARGRAESRRDDDEHGVRDGVQVCGEEAPRTHDEGEEKI